MDLVTYFQHVSLVFWLSYSSLDSPASFIKYNWSVLPYTRGGNQQQQKKSILLLDDLEGTFEKRGEARSWSLVEILTLYSFPKCQKRKLWNAENKYLRLKHLKICTAQARLCKQLKFWDINIFWPCGKGQSNSNHVSKTSGQIWANDFSAYHIFL